MSTKNGILASCILGKNTGVIEATLYTVPLGTHTIGTLKCINNGTVSSMVQVCHCPLDISAGETSPLSTIIVPYVTILPDTIYIVNIIASSSEIAGESIRVSVGSATADDISFILTGTNRLN